SWEKAGKELSKKKPNLSKATKELEKAVKIYSEFAAAWYLLGEVRVNQKDRTGAIEAFQQSMDADVDYVNPRVSLALIALEDERWEDAVQLSDEALEITPTHVKAHYFSAVANSSLGRIEAAETAALKVLDSHEVEQYPLVHYVLGWILSQRGEFEAAAARYRQFMEIKPEIPLSQRLREQMAGWAEQGLLQEPGT
ncbi:MAG: tetratricopeptide repeat protein, partial [Acidobacteriota bacterium]